MGFSIHSVYRPLFKLWRQRRARMFVELLVPGTEDTILDVGGVPSSWTGRLFAGLDIVCLNIKPIEWLPGDASDRRIETVVGDGTRLEYADRAFDIAFSNSVIEHVGDRDAQRAFARELSRVGRRLWVQTPARECPVEPHYLAPFVHWLPRPLRPVAVRYGTPWSLIQRPSRDEVERMVATTRLLDRREMAALFPDCRIITERLLPGIPKSHIAVRT